MATIGELILVLRGDSSNWKSEVKNAETALDHLAMVAKKVGQDLSKVTGENFTFADTWKKGMVDAVSGVISELDPIINRLTGYNSALLDQLVDTGEITSKDAGYVRDLALQELNAAKSSEIFQQTLNSLSAKLWVVTMGLQQMGRSLTMAFTVPIVALGVASVKTFADWETGTKNLQASADMTAGEANKMTDSFRDLASVMPLSVTELQEIARTAAEAGVSTKGLEKYTIAIAKLVTISKELNLKTAAEALVSVSKAFGISEDNVERVGSVIRKMAKESKGGMDDFTAALLRAMPAASMLSINFQDVSAMLAAIIPVSGTATRAGTNLTRMFDQMTTNLPKLASQMGITQDALKEMINKDAVKTLQTYIKGLGLATDQVETNRAVLEIFGQEGAKALRALIAQYNVFLKRQKESEQAYIDGTELTKDYNIASDTLANTFKLFQNAVLNVANAIGTDLNKVIVPVLNNAIRLTTTLAAIWISLPDPMKQTLISLAGILAILGPLILAINTLISPIVGLVTVLAKGGLALTYIKGLFGLTTAAATTFSVTTATTLGQVTTGLAATGTAATGATVGFGAFLLVIGKFLIIAAAVVIAIKLIQTALDKLSKIKISFGINLGDIVKVLLGNLGDKIKETLGLKGFEDRMNEIKKKVEGTLGDIETKRIEEAAEKIKDGLTGMAILAREWGDDIMLSFLKGFTQADFSVLNENLKVFESYFQILEKQGKLSTEQVLNNTIEARRVLAQAISDVKSLGSVSTETQTKIQSLVGAARSEGIIKQIMASVKVSQLQDTIDALNEQMKQQKDAIKQQTDIIDDRIKYQKKIYNNQIDAENDQVKLLEKQKRSLEKAYKSHLKVFQDSVDIAQREKDISKDRLDMIKESNQVFLDNLTAQRDALKDNVDNAKDTLQELEDLNQVQVDNAEGLLDYAKMNLESARNQLKKEEALGHDEWDATYRAALERTTIAGNQVDEAYSLYIKTKQLGTKEINIAKQDVKIAQTQLDLSQDQLDAAKKAADQQEKVYEDQIKAAENTLDAAKDTLDTFKSSYQDQSDLLQEQIDVHKSMVQDLQDARDEIVDKLTNERDILNEKYDIQAKIEQNKIDNAQKSLDIAKKSLEFIKGITDQYEAIQQAQIKAADKLSGGTDFAGIAAGDGGGDGDSGNNKKLAYIDNTLKLLDEVNTKLDEAQLKVDELKTTTPSAFNFESLGFGTQGFDISKLNWGKMKDDLIEKVKLIKWGEVGNAIWDTMFLGLGVSGAILSINWGQLKDGFIEKVKLIDWGKIGDTIIGSIISSLGVVGAVFDLINIGPSIYNAIVSGLSDLESSLKNIGTWIGQVIASGLGESWNTLKDAAKNIIGGIGAGLNDMWETIKSWGSSVGNWLGDGIKGIWNNIKDATKNIIGAIPSAINDLIETIKGWGTNIGQNLANGIYGVWSTIADATKNIVNAIPRAINDLWDTIKGWGKSIGEQLASGIYAAYDVIKKSASWIANIFKSFLGWFSPPEEGPMSTGDKWMPNMIKTLTRGITDTMPTLKGAVSDIGNTIMGIQDINPQPVIGTNFAIGAENASRGVALQNSDNLPIQNNQGINGNQQTININPGMMIASKGEIRSFVRLLESYTATEKTRTGI